MPNIVRLIPEFAVFCGQKLKGFQPKSCDISEGAPEAISQLPEHVERQMRAFWNLYAQHYAATLKSNQ